jgi:serine/threonine protein kinase
MGGANIKSYKVREELGSGSFGKVFRVKKDDINYAMKTYILKYSEMTEDQKADVKREVEALSSVDHPLVLKYFEKFITDDGKVHIVTEFAENGTLGDMLQNPEKRPENAE